MTEKADFDLKLRNAYHFQVAPDANKIEIKHAVEQIYAHKGVKVRKVRIITKHPKKRRFRFRMGATKAWKKAIVFLDKEHKLELF
jgi:large subunit ribosomal protein L23